MLSLVSSRSTVLLQRADGSAEVKLLPGPFLPTMVTSEAGAVRTYRFVDFAYDEKGRRSYTYVEDETLRLPLTRPSEVNADDGKALAGSPEARTVLDPDPAPPTGGVDRGDAGSGEV